MIFLPIVNIMTKKYKTRSRTRGGARRKKKKDIAEAQRQKEINRGAPSPKHTTASQGSSNHYLISL